MKNKILGFLKIAIVFFLCLITVALYNSLSDSSVDVLSKRGSRGTEVTAIQTRLKKWGYYSGNIDGIYGAQTETAVKYFQRKNGLAVDGIAGPATLSAIGLPTGVSNQNSQNISSNDLNLLARIISAESRGEPYSGQVAVGAVILNRVEHPSFPDTISGVIYQPGAFTALTDGQFNVAVADSARRAAQEALSGTDPSGGSIYYYNPNTASNQWIRTRPIVARIGKHVFCK